jgi:hypothetical protein
VELRKTRNSRALPSLGYAVLVNTAPDEYVVAGSDVEMTFTSNTSPASTVGLSWVREDLFKDGHWIPGRLLNGDEVQLRYDLSAAAADKLSGSGIRLNADGPYIQTVDLYRY